MWRFVPRSFAAVVISFGLPVNSMLAQTVLDPRTSWLAAAARFEPPRADAVRRQSSQFGPHNDSSCGSHAFNGVVIGALLGLVIGPLVLGYGDGHNGHPPSLLVVGFGSAGVGGLVGGVLGATARKSCPASTTDS